MGDSSKNWLHRWHSGKESACQCRRCKRQELYPWVGRSPGEVNGHPLQYSYLENAIGREACWTTVHRVTESDKTERLGDIHTHKHALPYESLSCYLYVKQV